MRRYFSDFNGQTVELASIGNLSAFNFAKRFPGVVGKPVYAGAFMIGRVDGSPTLWPVTRVVEFKQAGSGHVCNSKCRRAKSEHALCECSCGGFHHGVDARR